MKRFFILGTIVLFLGCNSNLKLYDQHALLKPIKRVKDDFYIKDFSNSYKRLEGNWVWGSGKDTLVLKFTPIFKKKYEENIFGYKNAYYDTCLITLKYLSNGTEILNTLDKIRTENCLYAGHLEIITTMFYVYNKCRLGVFDQPVLMFAGNDLVLVNKWNEEEGVFFEKDGEYKIVIPRTITLKRLE
ncbi:hypothetical protein EZV76_14705 [Flagellimonas alvinocaridis]|uniref:DUF6705 domain-containing protein n=1 Tax=Flagellimonas alvinocaridis TaxID=2530200 RepID=A0A4S8RGZ5_9FLAO|nr:DUF6705 family protein [Allomuricauda alvinocaridis]THV57608.1 hypothetical protein EZV76_14705 [Allomuricauda alvinocaridis]